MRDNASDQKWVIELTGGLVEVESRNDQTLFQTNR